MALPHGWKHRIMGVRHLFRWQGSSKQDAMTRAMWYRKLYFPLTCLAHTICDALGMAPEVLEAEVEAMKRVAAIRRTAVVDREAAGQAQEGVSNDG